MKPTNNNKLDITKSVNVPQLRVEQEKKPEVKVDPVAKVEPEKKLEVKEKTLANIGYLTLTQDK